MATAFNPRTSKTARRQPPAGRSERSRSRSVAASRMPIDFSLVHDVQRRATGANIHAIAQHLQIYVSAAECGAMSRAQAAEAHLRAFLLH